MDRPGRTCHYPFYGSVDLWKRESCIGHNWSVSPRVPKHREYPCLTSTSCAEQSLFASFRHRHLPPPQALLARQAQVPQARQVQLPPAVAQVPLLLRCLEFTWWNRNEAVSSCWFLVVNGSNVRRGCAVISKALQPMSCCAVLGLQGNGMSHDSFFYSIAYFCMRMNFHCLVHESCTQRDRFPPFRHRHLPPPQARQARLPPAVAQVSLLLRCLELTWWNRNEASSAVGFWW